MTTGTKPRDAAPLRFYKLSADERRILIRMPQHCDHDRGTRIHFEDIPLTELDAACSLIRRGLMDLQVDRQMDTKTNAWLVLTAAGRLVRDQGVG